MRVFVSAAEISSDIHAEKIIRAFLKLHQDQEVQVIGIGGPRLRSVPQFRTLARAESLRSMGFLEVASRIFEIRRIRDQVLKALRAHPPDVILTFDYPDFHFSLMRHLRREPWFTRTLKICGIPPKVWVWRSGRVEAIRRLFDGVWVIFPFEKRFYQEKGIPVIFEGNPLISDLLKHPLPKGDLRGLEGVRIAVLPGSRDAELDRHLSLIPGALNHLSDLLGARIIAEVPVPEGVSMSRIEAELISNDQVWYRLVPNGSAEILARNRVGLVKSGTSTLEAAVLGCVPVIFYRMSRVSEWLFKHLVRYAGPVGLPNILLGVRKRSECEYPELLGRDANAKALAIELSRLIQDSNRLDRLQGLGGSLRESLDPAGDVSVATAERISDWIRCRPAQNIQRKSSLLVALGSSVWSGLNWFRRRMRRWIFGDPPELPVASILVGNLQAGGAGKTPFVMELAREAIQRGFRVGIVTRGYGGSYHEKVRLVSNAQDSEVVGDEVAEMTAELPGVLVALSRDRMSAARALQEAGVNLIIADDGFQNLRFRTRYTALLVTDARRSEVGYRDFDSEATLADLVIHTKGRFTGRFPDAIALEWEPERLPDRPVWIWSAIGDPSELTQYYRNRGVVIQREFIAPDHARPDLEEVKNLMARAVSQGAILAVTPKDAVKIPAEIREQCFVLRRRLKRGPALEACFERIFQGLHSDSKRQ